MTILHASMVADGMLFWAEQAPAKIRRIQKRPTATIPTASLMVGRTEIKEIVIRCLPTLEGAKQRTVRVIGHLPTWEGLPIPSSATIAPIPPPGEPITAAPWGVWALQVDLEGAYIACTTLLNPELVHLVDVELAPDIRFWVQLTRFALRMVMMQRFMPAMVTFTDTQSGEKLLQSQWSPLLSPDVRNQLQQFVTAMPGSAIAFASPRGQEMPPGTLLHAFFRHIVDSVVLDAAFHLDHERLSQTQHRWYDEKYQTLGPISEMAMPSVHNQWLAGLFSDQRLISGETEDLNLLQRDHTTWVAPLLIEQSTRIAIAVRLEEPADDDQSWQVRFYAYDQDDRSLIVPLTDLGSPSADLPDVMRDVTPQQLRLLLGAFAGITPQIDAALQSRYPVGYTLLAEDAYHFLTHDALALEKAGCTVMLPSWWANVSKRQRKIAAHAKISTSGMGANAIGMEQLVHFDWKVAVGNIELKPEELESLARQKTPLVRLRGQWVQVNADEIRAAFEFWRKRDRIAPPTLGEALRLALNPDAKVGELEVDQVKTSGWIADLLQQLQGKATIEDLPVSPNLHATLRPYQARGFEWLHFITRWGFGACLADDMGLGKTVEALALLQHHWDNEGHAPVLLVCPTSVIGNWEREAQRFTPDLPLLVHHGSGRTRHDQEVLQAKVEGKAIVITSYALLQRDIDLLRTISWRGLILDEAQNIKNSDTKQALAARQIPARYRLALTGTPVENNIGDLWSIMEILNPGFLGTHAEFRRRFFQPIQLRQDKGATQALQQLTRPFILRRLKTDPTVITDLPEKTEMPVYCTLTKEQASLYAAVLRHMEEQLEYVEGIQRKGIILATLTKLKQVCNHPAHFLSDNSELPHRSGKLQRLQEMLEEVIAEGDRALIFTQYAEMGTLLQRYLSTQLHTDVLYLYGQVPQPERERMIRQFQQETGGPPIFVLSLKAGGTGLNLTRANYVFHYDRWWNPAVEDQATDRAFRIGQTRAVQVYKFMCAGTLEERIDELITSKRSIAGQIIGAGEAWLTELSTTQIRDLVALRHAVLEEV